MLLLFIDAAVLMGLIKSISDDDVNLGTALLLALGAALGVNALTYVLAPSMGIWGLLIAANVVGLLLGIAISALFGSEIKRSFFVGGIFVLVHIAAAVCLTLMMRA